MAVLNYLANFFYSIIKEKIKKINKKYSLCFILSVKFVFCIIIKIFILKSKKIIIRYFIFIRAIYLNTPISE